MTIHPEVLPDVFAVFKYLQEQGWTGIPYHTPPQFVKEWHSLIKENIAFFMCLSEKEQGDGFSDLKVQSVAVQSCFTENLSL